MKLKIKATALPPSMLMQENSKESTVLKTQICHSQDSSLENSARRADKSNLRETSNTLFNFNSHTASKQSRQSNKTQLTLKELLQSAGSQLMILENDTAQNSSFHKNNNGGGEQKSNSINSSDSNVSFMAVGSTNLKRKKVNTQQSNKHGVSR